MGEDKPGKQTMLRAVNRAKRALPKELQLDPLVELACELARAFDAGDRRVAAELRRTIAEVRRLGQPAPASRGRGKTAEPEPAEEVAEHDDLDDIAAKRDARRDELSRRRARRAGAADHDGAGARSAAGGDGRT